MTDTGATTPAARWALILNAVVAWTGVVLTVVFSALGSYDAVEAEEGLYGSNPSTAGGVVGGLSRVVETLSYFTIWSNIAVAACLTLLALRPARDGTGIRVLRLTSLLMITVTALVYQVVLASEVQVTGVARITDPILHLVTPVLTLAVWLGVGPRGWITARLLPGALALPAAWIVWMLLRGTVTDTYPYGFVNVVDLGYPTVVRNLVLVLVLALVIAAVFWAIDVVLRRRTRGDA